MVVHQAIREAMPARTCDGELQQAQIDPSIGVVAIERVLVVAASEDVMNRALDFFPWFAWHAAHRHADDELAPLTGSDPYSREPRWSAENGRGEDKRGQTLFR